MQRFRNHLQPQTIQKIRPRLQHGPALVDKLGAVVGATQAVTHRMRELGFDDVGAENQAFTQHRAGRGPETIAGDFVGREARWETVVAAAQSLSPLTARSRQVMHFRVLDLKPSAMT